MGRIVIAILTALLATLATLTPNYGQRGSASIDKYAIPAQIGFVNRNTNGVALSASGQTLNPAVRNLVLIVAGQSLCEDIAPTAYTPANPTKIDNLNVYDGALYVAGDPQIGTGYPNANGAPYIGPGNPYFRVADTLITNNKFDRVVLAPVCVGSTSVADWQSGITSNIFQVVMYRLADRNIVAGTNITIAAIWSQGVTDAIAGTTQVAYAASLNAIIANSRTAGFTGIWFINTESYTGSTVVAAIQNAQASVINHGASVWAGVNEDVLIGNACGGLACRAAIDGLHWSDAGSIAVAAGEVTAMALAGAPF